MKNKQTFAKKAKAIIGADGWAKLAKAMFETEEKEEIKVEEEMAEATLEDGTIIEYDKLEEGGKVMVITESGLVDAPDAAHTLTDGTVVTTEGGMIVSISRVEAPVEENMEVADVEVEHPTTDSAIEKMMDEKIEALYGKIKAMLEPEEKEEIIEEVKEEIKEEMRSIREGFGQMVELIENLMEDKATPETERTPAAQNFGRKPSPMQTTQLMSSIKEKHLKKNAEGVNVKQNNRRR